MPDYLDSVKQYLGSACEVLQLDNKLLFAGVIQQYDEHEEELTVEIRNGETPRGIIYHTPVKLYVQTSVTANKVLLLYGLVSRCAADFWKITLKQTFTCAERRSSFRQPIFVEAEVSRVTDEGPDKPTPCQMVDISLTGLCFSSKEHFFEGEHITVSSLQLRRGGISHSFTCTIRRIQRFDTGIVRYGCSFDNITERQEDQLFQDMFSLQVKSINRK